MATDEDETLWSSIPWQNFPPDSTSKGRLAWHKHRVPYKTDANELENLEIWVPQHSSPSSSSSTPTTVTATGSSEDKQPPPLSALEGTWVIYIHGGAWRDPLETSGSFTATLEHILQKGKSSPPPSQSRIAAFASLNYSLSPSREHPSSDPSRKAKHPQHILDVRTAIAFLQRLAGFGSNYVLLGHSCGAMLTFQVVMDAARWRRSVESSDPEDAAVVEKPRAVIGLNGLYDLPGLVHDPGEKHARWRDIYAEFTVDAFGTDEAVWRHASPFYVSDWVGEWGRSNGKAVLVQSREDTLVPYRQLEGMMRSLKADNSKGLDVLEMAASGDHTDLWEKGDRLAEIIEEVVKML